MEKYLCIHGHFYQPPRENAWLEFVELQDSAQPFHDWNERINFECYAPNTAARLLDDQERIVKIMNNYSRISFNFGPTLLSWMEKADPETYLSILLADKESQEQFGGHGSAVAQAHSHLILPLCNERDKQTQVVWGIRDFQHRFDRMPEGMWLAETAADTASLEVLAEQGIKYTILAPRQAKAFRKVGSNQWHDAHGNIETRRSYWCHLPSGRKIALFFYDGNVAQSVAFKGLLNNGKDFAHHLLSCFDGSSDKQLVNIATDGESYGHHHRHGEMAMADCLNYIEENGLAKLTNYGQYLELFPPEYEVQIHENSSWSCVHGVERWRSNCGCNSGKPGWNQEWRGPLRDALDWLRDTLEKPFEKEAGKLVNDPWKAREDFIEVILDRKGESIDHFLKTNAKKELAHSEKVHLFRLMEMQRNAMYMYTSCGWFFDEISGIETNQILQYALRAVDYAKQVFGLSLYDEFIKRLEKSPSNVFKNGAVSFVENVVPYRVGLERAGMHFAVSAIFEKEPEELALFNYISESQALHKLEAGTQKLVMGRTVMKSKITLSEKLFSYCVLYMGQQNLIGNISTDMDEEVFESMRLQMTEAFNSIQLGNMIGIMQTYFGPEKYTFRHLFRDEKRKVLSAIAKRNMKHAEASFRDIYNDNYQLIMDMLASNIPIPKTYASVAQFIINTDLQRFFNRPKLDITRLEKLLRELERWPVRLNDEQAFKLAAGERIYYEIKTISLNTVTVEHLKMLNSIFKSLRQAGLEPDIWKSQNVFLMIGKSFTNGERTFESEAWKQAFYELAGWLKVSLGAEVEA